MQNELQILDLVMQASWLVKGVMLILLLASVSSWVIIFRKRQVLNKAEKDADGFLHAEARPANLCTQHLATKCHVVAT